MQNNPFALPYLAPGKNTITVSVADAKALGDNKLVVTYAYRPGVRRKSYEQLCLEGKEIARGHDASWDKTPTVVQKVFTAGGPAGQVRHRRADAEGWLPGLSADAVHPPRGGERRIKSRCRCRKVPTSRSWGPG